jgi:tyrosyl-tRNA synthetase
MSISDPLMWRYYELLSVEIGLAVSTSAGKRLIEQGGLEIDGVRVTDPKAKLVPGGKFVVKAGKRAWAVVRT